MDRQDRSQRGFPMRPAALVAAAGLFCGTARGDEARRIAANIAKLPELPRKV